MMLLKSMNPLLRGVFVAGVGVLSLTVALPAIAQPCNPSAQRPANPVAQTPSTASPETATIAEIAASNDTFETLTAALEAAGLTDVLNGEDSFTVFAPTDEAFAALPEGTVEALLLPENRDQLIQVLTYHVVPGRVTSGDLSSGAVASVEGSAIDVMVGNSGVAVNDASVIQADITASNGVIHVIDKVLLPPAE